jgi:glycosyltransferase involved in cell wall biosynthesis
MQIGVFHPGTQHSWQTALALQDLDRLAWYATSIFYQPDRLPYRLERWLPGGLGERLHREFLRVSHPRIDPAKVRTAGVSEWLERISGRLGWRKLALKFDLLGNRRFVNTLADDIRSDRPFTLWGYNASSLDTFELAKAEGRTCILDRTIGDFRYYNAEMARLQERYGDWFLPTEKGMSTERIGRDQREYELADAILVGSEAAASTIRTHAGNTVAAKLRVLNYCFDEDLFGNQPKPAAVPRSGPIKFLFLGQANPRKGFHHALEAIAQLPVSEASLTIVGDLAVPASTFARFADRVTYLPPVARREIPAIMAAHHVLVFPSYFEGSALSLIEGLASGLALIQTPMSGAGVTERTGIMLDRPDSELLLAAMRSVIEDRDRLDAWRAAAQDEAQAYTFARYRERIAALLEDLRL